MTAPNAFCRSGYKKFLRAEQNAAPWALARMQASAQVNPLPGGVSDRLTASADSISIDSTRFVSGRSR
jgi:hypothetical protein